MSYFLLKHPSSRRIPRLWSLPQRRSVRVFKFHRLRLATLSFQTLHVLLALNSHTGQNTDCVVLHLLQQLSEHLKCFAFVFLFRVLLCITAQANTLTQVVHRAQVFFPVEVELLERRGSTLGRQNQERRDFSGGIFGKYAPHAIYLVSAFLGNIHSVQAAVRKDSGFPRIEVNELRVIVEAEKGLGTFNISCNSPRDSSTLNILGTTGKLHIDNLALTMTHSRFRGNRVHELVLDQFNLSLQLLVGALSSSIRALLGQRYYKAGHQVIIQRFVESIRDKLDPPVTGEDGRETIRILEDILNQIDQPNLNGAIQSF